MSTQCLATGHADDMHWLPRDAIAGTTSAAPLIITAPRDCYDCEGSGRYERDSPVRIPESQPAMLEVKLNDRTLTAPLLVLVSYRNGYYEIEHQEFGLFGCGTTQAEAVQDLVHFLMADYRQYALASDEELDAVARDLARRYRRLFGID